MDPSSAIGSVLAAFGLSGAAGLNAWLPLFASALLDRLGAVDLAAPFDDLSTTRGLVVLGALLVLDFVGDKVPALDHALHLVGTVVSPASGAALFVGQAHAGTDVPTLVGIAAGGSVAGLVHAARALLRVASSATTAGFGNPILSVAEDGSSAALTAISFVLPVLAAMLVVALVVAGLLAWWRRRAARARVTPGAAP
jgi:Na+/serine symporter